MAQALAWYLKAAAQGHARAQFNLGLMHASGQGARRDLLAAYAWLLQADQGGAPGARQYLHGVTARLNPLQLEHVKRLRTELSVAP
jgi:uncharacterized protein